MAGARKLVAANWKAYCTSETFKQNYSPEFFENIDVLIAVPFMYLEKANEIFPAFIQVCAQDMSLYPAGAYTGETNVEMLKDMNISYVLLGHSERRAIFNETSQQIAKKIKIALLNSIKVILCIGETQRERKNGTYMKYIENQMKESLGDLVEGNEKDILSNISIDIAYEPVWAIGTGLSANPSDIEEVALHIKNLMDKMKIKGRILYGGSVNAKNSQEIKRIKNIDGVLVGKVSITEEFVEISKIFNKEE
jgi:triosephosphate isomerase (TIM)